MIIKILRFSIFYLFVLLFLTACKSSETTKITETLTDEGYPNNNPYIEENNGYPDPVSTLQTINPNDIVSFPTTPDPNPGLGSLSAVLYTPIQSQVIKDTAFYLMPAIGENNIVPPIISGPDEKQGDVHGFTSNDGFLIINNINPDQYYLVVWSPYDWTLAENEEGKPLLIEILSDTKNELKVVEVPWP